MWLTKQSCQYETDKESSTMRTQNDPIKASILFLVCLNEIFFCFLSILEYVDGE